MKNLKPNELAVWMEYLSALPSEGRPKDAFVEASFAGGPASTDELICLYRDGRKTAGSGLVNDFLSAGEPLPKAGNFWIALDSSSQPRLVLKTVRTEINKFGSIPEAIARAEGEGDLSVAHWKAAHRALYAPSLARWGIVDLDEADVITEHFEIVYAPVLSLMSRL